jgi:glycosyltransferase involved in cell wall biosynthesis
MRVAYVCLDVGVPIFGKKGCSVHVQEVLYALLKRGFTVDVIAANLGGERPAHLAGLNVFVYPLASGLQGIAREQAALDLNGKIRQRLEFGEYDLIYERYSLWSYSAMEIAKARGIASVLEVNAPLVEEQAKHRSLYQPDLAQLIEKRVFSSAGGVLAVSDEVATYIKTRAPVQPRVIPNGVNLARFENSTPSVPSEQFTVGFVGTLKPWHGLDVLAEAFIKLLHKYPQSRLLIVGDGPQRASLEQRLLGLPVFFTGAVDPETIPGYLASIDVAVAPYPPLDNFYFSPLKLFEYMAAGRPVVASRIGQIERVVTHRQQALLCTPGDAEALCAALESLATQPALAQTLADAAKELAQSYSWDNIVTKILEFAKGQAHVLA